LHREPDLARAVFHGKESSPMADLIFVTIGALCLGICVLYALACEQL
jgi:hypothetical protein